MEHVLELVSRVETTRALAGRKHALFDETRYPLLADLSAPIQAEMLAYATLRKRESSQLARERCHNSPESKVLSGARRRIFRSRLDLSLSVILLPVEEKFTRTLGSKRILVSIPTYQQSPDYETALRAALGRDE
jgi:hypothetical protein